MERLEFIEKSKSVFKELSAIENKLANKIKMIHKLKTVNPYFNAVWHGVKTFEVRVNDRDFKVGDFVHLLEYDYTSDDYSGREVHAEIIYVLKNMIGIKDDYIVFGFTINTRIAQGEVVKLGTQK